MAPPAVEFASFAPLAQSSLVALAELGDEPFRRHIAELFPLLTQLVRADYAPPEVRRALAGLLARSVGPLVMAGAAMVRGSGEARHGVLGGEAAAGRAA
jgi:brefeldin A-inhibited guanine nucleotide-exchange protein